MPEIPEYTTWQVLSSQQVYDNAWITVNHEEVIAPTGAPGIYGTVHFKNVAIGIIPLDTEGNTWLVGQYRHVPGVYSWEIPEGGGLLHEDPLSAAKRELREEVGLEARTWTELLRLHTSNSVTDERSVVFVARDLSVVATEHGDTEQLQVIKLPFQQAVDMVLAGEISDAISMAAILKLDYWLKHKML
jgi:8-oxo-dGTP pyrophosphatase MutT (NUDIX family)